MHLSRSRRAAPAVTTAAANAPLRRPRAPAPDGARWTVDLVATAS